MCREVVLRRFFGCCWAFAILIWAACAVSAPADAALGWQRVALSQAGDPDEPGSGDRLGDPDTPGGTISGDPTEPGGGRLAGDPTQPGGDSMLLGYYLRALWMISLR